VWFEKSEIEESYILGKRIEENKSYKCINKSGAIC